MVQAPYNYNLQSTPQTLPGYTGHILQMRRKNQELSNLAKPQASECWSTFLYKISEKAIS